MLKKETVILCVAIGLAVGIVFMALMIRAHDYRSFAGIKESCSQVGFIQDNRTRIYCHFESPDQKAK